MKHYIPIRPNQLRLLWRQPVRRRLLDSIPARQASTQAVKVYPTPRRRSWFTSLPTILLITILFGRDLIEWRVVTEDEEQDEEKKNQKEPGDDEESNKNDKRIKKKLRLVRKKRNTGKSTEVETQVTSLTGVSDIPELGDENFPRINLSVPTSKEPFVVILPPSWQEKGEPLFGTDEDFKLIVAFQKDQALRQKGHRELKKFLRQLFLSGGSQLLGGDVQLDENTLLINWDYPTVKPPKRKAYCLEFSQNEVAFGETEVDQDKFLLVSRHLDTRKFFKALFHSVHFYYELKMIKIRTRLNIDDPSLYEPLGWSHGLLSTEGLFYAGGLQTVFLPAPRRAALICHLRRWVQERQLERPEKNGTMTRNEDKEQSESDVSKGPRPWWAKQILNSPRKNGPKTDVQETMTHFYKVYKTTETPDPNRLLLKSGDTVFSGVCTVRGNKSTMTYDYLVVYNLRTQKCVNCRMQLRRLLPGSTALFKDAASWKLAGARQREGLYKWSSKSSQTKTPSDNSSVGSNSGTSRKSSNAKSLDSQSQQKPFWSIGKPPSHGEGGDETVSSSSDGKSGGSDSAGAPKAQGGKSSTTEERRSRRVQMQTAAVMYKLYQQMPWLKPKDKSAQDTESKDDSNTKTDDSSKPPNTDGKNSSLHNESNTKK